MNKSSFIIMGVILAILGAIALSGQKISYTTRDTVIDAGPLQVTADRQKDLSLSPILGGIALAGSVGLIVMGIRK